MTSPGVADRPGAVDPVRVEHAQRVGHVLLDREGRPADEGGVPRCVYRKRREQVAELVRQAVEVVGHGGAAVEEQRRRAGAATVPPKRPDLERRLARTDGEA